MAQSSYADPETYLIPREQWPAKRADACRLLGAPENGAERLHQRQGELEAILARLDRGFPQNEYVRLVGDDLTISPVRGEDPPESAEQLRDRIVERLPKVDLPDLLIEVERWTGFSRAFQHAGAAEPRTKDLLAHLHAAIFAQACNFGLEQMAELAGLSYRKLAWCATWYLREDTLKAAIAQVVNFQRRQPLARAWGSGTLSSSDGQRFPVAVKARHATALPRYFGYGRGLTHYTWTSDQHALYRDHEKVWEGRVGQLGGAPAKVRLWASRLDGLRRSGAYVNRCRTEAWVPRAEEVVQLPIQDLSAHLQE